MLQAVEGVALTGVAVATALDTGPLAAEHAATIAWGDGSSSSSSSGTVSGSGGTYTVSGSHTYSAAGTYVLAVTVTDAAGNNVTAYATVVVAGQPLTATAYALNPVAGTALAEVPVGFIADSNSAAITTGLLVQVAWGDGTESPGLLSGSAGQFVVRGSHTYAEPGNYILQVTAIDPGGSFTIASAPVSVVPPPLVVNVSATPLLMVFKDTNPDGSINDFTATINWGDPNYTNVDTVKPTQGDGAYYLVYGTHTFTAPGVYTVDVLVTDFGGAEVSDSTQLIVVGPPVTPAAPGTDPERPLLETVDEATIDVNAGGLRLSQPLDFDQSPGTAVGGNPALDYNSATVSVKHVVTVVVPTSAGLPLPQSITLTMTWNGTTLPPVTFFDRRPPTRRQLCPGRPGNCRRERRLRLVDRRRGRLRFLGHGQRLLQRYDRGREPGHQSVRAGWGLDGIDRLVAVGGGILWISGTGDGRFFAGNGSGGFVSPDDDFGTLIQNSLRLRLHRRQPEQGVF